MFIVLDAYATIHIESQHIVQPGHTADVMRQMATQRTKSKTQAHWPDSCSILVHDSLNNDK
jgi:hypothetical protein